MCRGYCCGLNRSHEVVQKEGEAPSGLATGRLLNAAKQLSATATLVLFGPLLGRRTSGKPQSPEEPCGLAKIAADAYLGRTQEES
jgi:hypothetical protein